MTDERIRGTRRRAKADPSDEATAAKRGRGRPALDPAGGDATPVPVRLTAPQRAEAELLAREHGLQGVAAAVRMLLDASAAARA